GALRPLADSGCGVKPFAEVVEALAEAESRGYRVGGHESGGAVPGALQARRERQVASVEKEGHVLPHAMARRSEAGEDRRVRGARQGSGRRRIREARPRSGGAAEGG